MTQSPVSFPLEGGMDLVTPAIKMPPGRVIASLNYEPVSSGYQRLRGFERFDGQTAPSAAPYWRLNFDGGIAAIVAGNTVAGQSSGATYVVIDVTLTSGSWAGGDAAGYLGLRFSGVPITAFTDNENIRVGGVTKAIANGTNQLNTAPTTAIGLTWQQAAAVYARSLITVVPGSGSIRGIWTDDTYIYAARDNAGATASAIYYASATGWLNFNFGSYVNFTSGGAYELQEGDVISDGSFSVGVRRIALLSGSWAGGDAAGYFYTDSNALTSFTTGETLNVGANMNVLTVGAAASSGTTLPVGGRYLSLRHNFFGAANRTRSYVVNGVSQAFEMAISGGNRLLAPIFTGMPVDKPTRIAAHRESLFLAFPGGSVQFSQVGEPVAFNAVLGAGEIGLGCEITDFIPATEGALTILGESKIAVLYGNDSSDYQLEMLSSEAGALAFTAQKIGNVIYMDNGGIRSLSATSAYGNFTFGSISRLIAPLLEDYRRDGVTPTASFKWKIRDQYWLFFDNGTAIIVYFGRKQPEIMPINLGVTVTCASSFKFNGIERAFVGTSTGYVMELDKGTSFDGSVIEHYFRLPFNSFGAPDMDKRAFKVELQLEASGTTTLSLGVDFDYGAVDGLDAEQLTVTTGGAAIDSLGSNELYYASQIETLASRYIDGVARNFSLKISGSTSTEEPHVATGVTYHLAARRLVR